MIAIKRILLITLIIITLFFISYQLYLICLPLATVDSDKKFVHLVDQYRILKMERLVLEEQIAVARARQQKIAVNTFVQGDVIKINNNRIQSAIPEQQPVALSLAETKTFERLEAYVNDNKPAAAIPISQDEKNLLEAQASDYTLQLMGVRDIHELKRFVRDNNLQGARIFHTYYLNNDWYVLVYGSYKNHTEALRAMETIPYSIQELKPWIRQLCSIQKAIQLYR